MKKTSLRLLAIGALLICLAGPAQSMDEAISFVSGKDWVQQMSPKEKLMSLLPPMALYNKFGVHLQRTVFEYIDTMDTELATNPRLEGEDVANIFASTVYALEPENRLPLERMGTVFGILKKHDAENPHPLIALTEE